MSIVADESNNIFQDEWLQEEQLQQWLVKVSNDFRRTYCRFCAVVLRSVKAELYAHCRTQTHIANASAASENGTPTGPISVQIVTNEDEGINNQEEDFSSQEIGDEEEVEFKPVLEPHRAPVKRTPNSAKYIKKYRPAWEEEEDFKDWLQAYPEDVQRAFCKACKAILRAHKHDLTCHARTTRHQKKIQEFRAEQGGDQLFQMIAEDVVTLPQTKIRAVESVQSISPHIGDIGIEIDTSGMGLNNNDSESGDDKKLKLVKMTRTNLNSKPITIAPKPVIGKKRGRVNAADVVAAIENNEFTGYELLQIVKKAVPKL